MELLKGLRINLQAAGPAGLFGVWFIAVALLGVFGSGPIAEKALGLLALAGVTLLLSGYLFHRE